MDFVIKGLVLRSTDYREADKILTVFSDTMGKITVKARGARRKNSRLAAGSQLYVWSEMTVTEYQGRYLLNEVEPLESFLGLQRDLECLSLAAYLMEVLSSEGENDASDGEALRLALNSLYALSRRICKPRQVKPAFELRYMALSGYAPRLSCCAVCGRAPTVPMLDLEEGLLHCAGCPTPGFGRSMPLDGASLEAMRYFLSADVKRIFSYTLPEQSMGLLERVCEAYLLKKTERSFRTLDFYKTVGES